MSGRCTCRALNDANGEPGVIIMCDDCVLWEIRRLDAHCDDGRTGYVCDKCGAPAWEPQGGTTCADCLEGRDRSGPRAPATPVKEGES